MGGFVATSFQFIIRSSATRPSRCVVLCIIGLWTFQFINKYVSRKNEAVLWSLKNEATDKNYFNSMKMTDQNRNRLRP
jgi:hypothetical protein